jgi:hypothetical protein
MDFFGVTLMQDFCLLLALIGVIVVPVFIAARMGRKPQKAEQRNESPALHVVSPKIAYAERKTAHRVAILPIKG